MHITLDKFIKVSEWREGVPYDYALTDHGKKIINDIVQEAITATLNQETNLDLDDKNGDKK